MSEDPTYLTLALQDAIHRAPGSMRALAREAGVPHTTLVRVRSGALEASPAVVARVAATLEQWSELCKRHAFRLQQEVYRAERQERAPYTAFRGGSAPEELRQAFTAWLEAGSAAGPVGQGLDSAKPLLDDRPVSVEWLCGQLWNCTDVLPRLNCDALGIPPGSTIARAVRRLRRRGFR
jgi:hypothetical protein